MLTGKPGEDLINGLYTELLLVSLLQTLQDNGTISKEESDTIFRRAATLAEGGADTDGMPVNFRNAFAEVHKLLLEGISKEGKSKTT